jgi:hypothetical protein
VQQQQQQQQQPQLRLKMLHPTHLIPIMAAWHLSMTEISKYTSAPIGKNINHLLHTLIWLLHYTQTYEMEHATHISIGFFSYDIIYLLCHADLSRNALYILHHGIAIYLLNVTIIQPNRAESILKGYSILESSNIMLFVSYHVQKKWPHRQAWVHASEFVQLLWYMYYRIFKMTIFLYQNREEVFMLGNYGHAMVASVYLMGVMWSCKLIIKNVQHFAALKKNGSII